jgi:dihydroorotate dehydrogenase
MPSLYSLIRPLVFALDAETAHDTALELLNSLHLLLPRSVPGKPVEVMGLKFANPVGLAAGLDKNGDYLPGLSRLGFGFIEIGTVTPRAQPGNPKPRLFRLVEQRSIINRLGFNNKGVDHLLHNLENYPRSGQIIGVNIGKNLTTPVEQALDDYLLLMDRVYPLADYITVNISSPNTPGLRKLQNDDELEHLLGAVVECRKRLADMHGFERPIALKIAPDLRPEAIAPIAEKITRHGIDALIATNTTLDRRAVVDHPLAQQAGGLSGCALRDKARDILVRFNRELAGSVPIISAGGIDSVEEARLRLDLGASLVQIYSALIFSGPQLVRRIARGLAEDLSTPGCVDKT